MSIGCKVGEERCPRKKVKFMYSFGGKILPRPSDGVLKYVGGETRIVAVSLDISFFELSQKLRGITENDIVLKYQIIPEDLDVLVSVKSDEDLKHMIEEYNRHETPKLRTFLFPTSPEHQLGLIEPQTLEHRYIEAINGIRHTKNVFSRAPIKTRPFFTFSACSSPKSESSPDIEPDMGFQYNYQLSRLYPLHKVHSSPNILQQFQPHNAVSDLPNYLTCRLQPKTLFDFQSPSGWETAGQCSCRCNEDLKFWGRGSSVPQSPRNHRLRL